MGEPAMVREANHRTLEAPEHIQVWSFGRQGHGCGGQRGFSIKSRPGQNGSGQKMSNGFQTRFVPQVQDLNADHVEIAASGSPTNQYMG